MNSLYLTKLIYPLEIPLALYVLIPVLIPRLGLQRYDQPILTTKFFRNFFSTFFRSRISFNTFPPN